MFTFLHILDIEWFIHINSNHSPFFDIFFSLLTHFGSGWVVVPVLTAIIILKIRPGLRKNVLLFTFTGLALAGIINGQIKRGIKRPRPVRFFQKYQPQELGIAMKAAPIDSVRYLVHVVGPRLRHRSYPLGHTNTAFSSSIIVILLLGGWYWSSLILAFIVAFSRIYIGVHFPLDTVAGGIVGIIVIMAMYVLFRKMNWRITDD